MAGSTSQASAYGVLAHRRKDQLHLFARGFAYASPWVVTGRTMRPVGVVLLTVDGAPFTVDVGGRRWQHNAFALAPNVARGLVARGVRLVSLNVTPGATLFPAFRAIATAGLALLDRRAFAPYDAFLAGLYTGVPAPGATGELFDAVVRGAIAQFARPAHDDPRLAAMLAALADTHDDAHALQQLSTQLGLSYHRTSHLFSSALGIPLRSYLAWKKQQRLYLPLLRGGASLTEVAHAGGLPDSAYLSRIYQQWYGQRPSFARDSKSVQVFLHDVPYPARSPSRTTETT